MSDRIIREMKGQQLREFVARQWGQIIVLLFCIVPVVIVVATCEEECDEVCAESGMVHVERSHGCAVACLCRPGHDGESHDAE